MADVVNKDVYKEQFQWQEGEYTVTRTTQWSGPGCHDGCGVLYYTKDNKLVKVEGDPNSPYNQGRLCMRCLNMPEVVNHPDRLKWPLKRVGQRGENKWQRISWDEAYDIIVENVRKIQQECGPESIVGMLGTGRNACWQAPLITYAGFGSPNLALGFLSGDSCMLPRTALHFAVMGDQWVADMSQFRTTRYDADPEWKRPDVIIIWGNNPIYSNSDAFLGHWIVEAMKRGSKLIVMDPKLTWLAGKAEYWLRLRPGTDAALALGMMNVIINEELYDREFVKNWTYGFDKLAERVQEYPPEKVAEICWVPKEKIVEAARFFAQANPGCIQWGLPVDQSKIGIPAAHAITCLSAICGNIEVPGGNILVRQAAEIDMAYNRGYFQNISEEMRRKRLGDEFTLHKYGFSASAHPDTILKAMETGEPYPIKMLWLQSTNPIANMAAEAPRVYEAIKKMDFVAVVDLFMTPTAVAFADVVLPAAMNNERNCFRTWFDPLRAISKVTQYEECKSDEQIILELGKRLNPAAWPWETDIEMLDSMLAEGTDFTFKELEQKVMVYGEHHYRKHEKGLLRRDGQPGFETPTGRLELYITAFESWGVEPLPFYEEPPESPYSRPELFTEYPLVLTTGARNPGFFHSEHRQVKTMREFHPQPLVRMHPETAAKYGINEGDWVWIENMRGRCKQKAKFDITFDPRVIAAEHGWWFPEKEAAEPVLFGVFDANPNNLVPQFQHGPTGYGAPYKCQICKIYKATEENSKVTPTEQVTRLGGFKYDRKYE